ncbi:potassium transporter Kup [Glycomyces luteolus]|uniref:Probable potassium transport system protein Kup n=1 Tax=Glycomyces luteolus TaxID=2670330 RepID=A0A9X3P8M3_9ACTN|nr:potassium transporter Kup [Glycomyces luteolus]MDA1359012.1 potassium transporter Kup [Glycomyces luteolus]
MTSRFDASAPDPAPDPESLPAPPHSRVTPRGTLRLAVVVGALGVVFGDIGTSPIYALQTIFNPADPHPVPINDNNVYGIISLIFWSMTLVVTVFYVGLAMRADNDGEGGIMALITLIRRHGTGLGRRTTLVLAALGIFGATLFLGDSMITPAISVLSAVEGLKVIDPVFDVWVVPVTAVIIVLLFGFQRKGTATIGRLFGPVMIVWFATLALLGIGGIGSHPEILRALSPTYAAGFLVDHFHIAFFALAAVVLTFTGAEALYADMGHFGRRNITAGWIFFVFPALLLNYMGQGAMILESPENVSGPFFLLSPEWGRIPLLVLATAATVIASQAVITGAYSVASQASKLGYLPRLRIAHTSEHEIGQIYVPWINWMLMVSVLTLVFAFRSSAALAYAYGMAVVGTITIVALLFCFVARIHWHAPRWLVLTGGGLMLAFNLLFLAANTTKLAHGAWLPLVIGIGAFAVMVTWQRGREIVTDQRDRLEGSLREFVGRLNAGEPKVAQVPGTAVFLNRGATTAPLAMRANMERNHVRHAQIVILSVETEPVPRVAEADRVLVDDLGLAHDGIIHVTARFGYMEPQDVPAALRLVRSRESEGRRLKLKGATYFLSTIQLRVGREPTMAAWRKRLFIATSHITADAADHFKLPRERTVTIGAHIEV